MKTQIYLKKTVIQWCVLGHQANMFQNYQCEITGKCDADIGNMDIGQYRRNEIK